MLIFLFCAGDPLRETESFCTARAKHAKRNGFAQPAQNTLKIDSIQLCVQFARRRATFTKRGTPLAPKSVPRFINVARRLRQATWRPRFHQNIKRQIVKSVEKYKIVKRQLLYIDKIRETCLKRVFVQIFSKSF